jgi:hypothetical protein
MNAYGSAPRGYGDIGKVSTDFGAEQERIAQQQRLADLLQAQGMKGTQGGMVGPVYVKPSITQGLSQLLSAYMGGKMHADAATQKGEIGAQKGAMLADIMQRAGQPTQTTETPLPEGQMGPGAPMTTGPNYAELTGEAMRVDPSYAPIVQGQQRAAEHKAQLEDALRSREALAREGQYSREADKERDRLAREAQDKRDIQARADRDKELAAYRLTLQGAINAGRGHGGGGGGPAPAPMPTGTPEAPPKISGLKRDKLGNITLSPDVQANVAKPLEDARNATAALRTINDLERYIDDPNMPASGIGATAANLGQFLPDAMKPESSKVISGYEGARNKLMSVVNDPRMKGNPAIYEGKKVLETINDPTATKAVKKEAIDRFRQSSEMVLNAHNTGLDQFDEPTLKRLEAMGITKLDVPKPFESVRSVAGKVKPAQAVGAGPLPASAAPPPEQRVAGQKYQTPRGMMTWTGTGWLAN